MEKVRTINKNFIYDFNNMILGPFQDEIGISRATSASHALSESQEKKGKCPGWKGENSREDLQNNLLSIYFITVYT